MDAVRVDTGLTGRIPGKNVPGIGKVGDIEAGIEEIGWFPKGHRIGGEHGHVIKKPTKSPCCRSGISHGFGVDQHIRAQLH